MDEPKGAPLVTEREYASVHGADRLNPDEEVLHLVQGLWNREQLLAVDLGQRVLVVLTVLHCSFS